MIGEVVGKWWTTLGAGGFLQLFCRNVELWGKVWQNVVREQVGVRGCGGGPWMGRFSECPLRPYRSGVWWRVCEPWTASSLPPPPLLVEA
jgi:hypothetical protein